MVSLILFICMNIPIPRGFRFSIMHDEKKFKFKKKMQFLKSHPPASVMPMSQVSITYSFQLWHTYVLLLHIKTDRILDTSSDSGCRDLTVRSVLLLVVVLEERTIRTSKTRSRNCIVFHCICYMDLYVKCYCQSDFNLFCVVSSLDYDVYGIEGETTEQNSEIRTNGWFEWSLGSNIYVLLCGVISVLDSCNLSYNYGILRRGGGECEVVWRSK